MSGDTAIGHVKWTFSDDCLGAVRFPSGGTGAMIDGDRGFGWGDLNFTSDRVGNKVDRSSGYFEDPIQRRAYIVVPYVVAAPGGARAIGDLLGGVPGSTYIPLPGEYVRPPVLAEAFESVAPPPAAAPARPLADELGELRESLDLPVSDLARLTGLGRRQFYNLLSGGQTVPATEARIRRVVDAIRDLRDALGGDADRVRAAVLTPVGANSLSLFDAASLGDEALIRETLEALRLRVAGRGIRRTRRAVPRAASPEQRQAKAERIREELDDLSSSEPEIARQGEPGGPD